jgi:uncharacterized protein YkwD
MRSPKRRLAVLMVCAAGALQAGGGSASAAPAQPHGTQELEVAAEIQTIRAAHELRRLRLNDRLGAAARTHSADMVATHSFSHVSADRTRLLARIRATGYLDAARAWWIGEALAWHTGTQTATEVVDGWMASPPHRRLLLSRRPRELGVGMAPGVPALDAESSDGATWAIELAAVRR